MCKDRYGLCVRIDMDSVYHCSTLTPTSTSDTGTWPSSLMFAHSLLFSSLAPMSVHEMFNFIGKN